MTATREQARDQISQTLVTVWPVDTDTGALFFDDLPGATPAADKVWARLTIRHNEGGQATLTDQSAKKRYRRTGVVTVQLFTPNGGGLSKADKYVKIILDAFEGKTSSGGVWFRNGRAREVGADGEFFQTNVLIDFEYDELK